jgi:uncharacterized membrane protein (UPF0127 family)
MFGFPRRAAAAAFVAAALLAPGLAGAQPAPNNVSFQHSTLVIESGGKSLNFKIEIADTDAERELGLMYRNALPANAGMLFDFKQDQQVDMWMHNTHIPLDMLFIDRTGRIVNIAQRAVPYSDETISSAGPVRAVLEVNGGTAARLGIKAGDRVIYAIFHNAAAG